MCGEEEGKSVGEGERQKKKKNGDTWRVLVTLRQTDGRLRHKVIDCKVAAVQTDDPFSWD